MSVVVCDASAVVALLLNAGPDGEWAAAQLERADLVAPDLLGYESANVLRRHELENLISPDTAAQAHADLLDLDIEMWPYALLAARAWELRRNLPVYDAAYVALAELLQASLVTLDARIAGAPGVRCAVVHPAQRP